jgi:flagellar basal-body rod protein FlgB
MFENLSVFKTAFAMASHAGQRQAVIAQNMANADTPGYRRRDLVDFETTFNRENTHGDMKATRSGHFQNKSGTIFAFESPGLAGGGDPNSNNVSVQEEMLKAVEVKRQHDRATAIYKSSLGILRATLARA